MVQFLSGLENGATLHNLRQNLQNDVIIISYVFKNELAVAVVAIKLWILQPLNMLFECSKPKTCCNLPSLSTWPRTMVVGL